MTKDEKKGLLALRKELVDLWDENEIELASCYGVPGDFDVALGRRKAYAEVSRLLSSYTAIGSFGFDENARIKPLPVSSKDLL